jgi:hypothetical protein
MSDEPLPVIALDYHQADELAGWFAVARLLAILCVVADALGALYAGFAAWNYAAPGYRSMYARSGYAAGWVNYAAGISVAVVCANLLQLIGAIGCLRRSERMRRFTVVCCWIKLAVALLSSVGNIGFYASRTGALLWLSVGTVLGREFAGGVLLTIATAIILSRPEVKRAFAMGDGPITR